MLVNLKRDFFGPDAVQYKVLDNPHNFNDDWVLPKDVEKLKTKPTEEELEEARIAAEAAATEKAKKKLSVELWKMTVPELQKKLIDAKNEFTSDDKKLLVEELLK